MHFTSVVGFAALTFLLSTSASPVPVDSSSRGSAPASSSVLSIALRSSSPRAAAPDPQTSMPAWRIRAAPETPNAVDNNPDWRRHLD